MKLNSPDPDIYVPDGCSFPGALERTTHLCVGAHQDDQELMAYHGIAACYDSDDNWFSGVIVTNGGGSARVGAFADYSDEQMMAVRKQEQRKAADIGRYACQIQLGYPSSAVKNPSAEEVTLDLATILRTARPECVYVHNPADKHDTHVAVVARTIQAIRTLDPGDRPETVYGCELWRSLDWLCDSDKQVMEVDYRPELAAELCAVFESQISGGKRYDHAIVGRRRSNATFFESHEADKTEALAWGMDLTPLARDPSLDICEYTCDFIRRMSDDVVRRIRKCERSG